MKKLLSLKSIFTLCLLALGVGFTPTAAQANIFGQGAEIVILTTDVGVTFNYNTINLSNWGDKNNPFGMPHGQKPIAKGEDITIHNTTDGLVSLKFTRQENGDIRVDFPLGILSKRNPDDGCDGGLIAKGCGASDPGEVYGIGFPYNLQERIYSEVPAYFKGEGMKILFRASADAELVPWSENNPYSPIMIQNTLVKIKVQEYPAPQFPGANQNVGTNEKVTSL